MENYIHEVKKPSVFLQKVKKSETKLHFLKSECCKTKSCCKKTVEKHVFCMCLMLMGIFVKFLQFSRRGCLFHYLLTSG